ncbi:MAG: hypothetical protein JO191_07335 [Mycobacteriaceae bacterium]|nr:hypothetical protein [Mycobacteriaceae bacterium]
MTIRIGRLVILGGLAVFAAFGPALTSTAERVDAKCLAVFGSRDNGICLDGPSAPAPDAPSFGLGPTDGNGLGVSSSPLFPGQTIQMPLG